jgi:hypothetical protein
MYTKIQIQRAIDKLEEKLKKSYYLIQEKKRDKELLPDRIEASFSVSMAENPLKA